MTSNFWSFFIHWSVYLPVNIPSTAYKTTVCLLSLYCCLKTTFEISILFLSCKNYKKHCMLFKTTFEIRLLLITEVRKQTATFDYYQYGVYISLVMGPSKKAVFTFVTSSLFSNLLFSSNSFSLLQS